MKEASSEQRKTAPLAMSTARRNRIALPYANEDEVVAAYDYVDLEDFLRIYYEGIRVLVTERDFYEVTRAFLDRCRTENIVYVEISFDPQPHLARHEPKIWDKYNINKLFKA